MNSKWLTHKQILEQNLAPLDSIFLSNAESDLQLVSENTVDSFLSWGEEHILFSMKWKLSCIMLQYFEIFMENKARGKQLD